MTEPSIVGPLRDAEIHLLMTAILHHVDCPIAVIYGDDNIVPYLEHVLQHLEDRATHGE